MKKQNSTNYEFNFCFLCIIFKAIFHYYIIEYETKLYCKGCKLLVLAFFNLNKFQHGFNANNKSMQYYNILLVPLLLGRIVEIHILVHEVPR